ncbi:MAG: IPT/TIG domain-containing protein [Myxococcota bacterium]
MNGRAPASRGIAVEDFVQALTAQLDRAQDLLALKARAGRPLTFALKDLSVDLKVFWESDPQGRISMRHAGPNEEGASTVRLGFTTITRAMAEENSVSLSAEEDPRALSDLRGGGGLEDEDRRRLELAGVRTVGQFKRLNEGTDPKSMESYLGIPVMRLQSALQRASRPTVTGTAPVQRGDGRSLLRIRGANLGEGPPVEVRLSGEPVEVLQASAHEIVVRPRAHHADGPVEVVLGSGETATGFYEITAAPEALRKPVSTVEPLSTREVP